MKRTAENYYLDHFNTIEPPKGSDVLARDYSYRQLIGFAKAFASYKVNEFKLKKDSSDFKPSARAACLAYEIYHQFNIALEPKIRRRYLDNERIKFEMKDTSGKVYYFENIVLIFLCKDVNIYLTGDTFNAKPCPPPL